MLEIERAIINLCLHHNSTPSANGSVPSSFVFAKSLRTRLSAQCTESVLPAFVPVFVRAENQSTDATRMSVVMVVWFMMLTLLLTLSVMMATNQYRQSWI